jgi:alkylation response protein AidB-like acyl-CoA dehydrogenase
MHKATNCFIFARTSGKNGDAKGISCFNVPSKTPGVKVESYQVCRIRTDHFIRVAADVLPCSGH